MKDQTHTIIRISVALLATAATVLAPQFASAATPVSAPPSSVTITRTMGSQSDDANKTDSKADTLSGDSSKDSKKTGKTSSNPLTTTNAETGKPASRPGSDTSQPTAGIAPKSATLGSASILPQGKPIVGTQDSCTDTGKTTWGDNAYWQVDGECTLHFGTTDPSQGTGTLQGGITDSDPYTPWYDYSSNILKVLTDNKVYAPVNASYLLSNLTQIDSVAGLDKLDTSRTTNMSFMFSESFYTLSPTVNLRLPASFDTSNVTDMHDFFHHNYNLISIDLGPNFDTSKVTNMDHMFYYCDPLQRIDLGPKFDTTSVTSMTDMFYNSISLKMVKCTPKTHFTYDRGYEWTNEDGSWTGDPNYGFGNPTRRMWYGKLAVSFTGGDDATGEAPAPLMIPDSTSEDLTMPGAGTLKRAGYRFLGWSTSASATAPDYAEGSALAYDGWGVSDMKKLYAVWERIPAPTVRDMTAPKSLGGMPVAADGTVIVAGALGANTNMDGTSVRLLPAGSTSNADDAGVAARNVTADTDANTWTATFQVSDLTGLAADTTGTGTNYVIRAKAFEGTNDSAYVFKTERVDMVAPAATEMASGSQKVTGKVLSAQRGLTGITATPESGDTVTVTWLDNASQTIGTSTDVQSSDAAGHVGEFSADWPTNRHAVKAKVQVTDTTGNTSAPVYIDLDRLAAPTVNVPDAPKMVGGKTPTSPVTIGGGTIGAQSGDGVDVRLLPADKTAADAEDNQGTASTDTSLDTATNKWTAKFPVSAFTADKTGTGARYTFCARLHTTQDGDSAYTCAEHLVDLTAPVATELAFTTPTSDAKGTLSGKAISVKNGLVGVTPQNEADVTLTLDWLDAKGQPLITPDTLTRNGTPLRTTAISGPDGTFTAQWPEGVAKGDQVIITAKDVTGNTSAPNTLELGKADEPSGPAGNNANGTDKQATDKPAAKLSATGATISAMALAATLMAMLGLTLRTAKSRARAHGRHAKQ
ncbi:BspA family leucine-rich repeat surface protein [Bifidobacterium sp. ESL0732]|uniref:BspA family leucine-rich repeat surface protein n=1 Tax=Bifidobacterium sp. ESL0732 TaxID=2983222 RepID=UPI0023F88830|nr:BspA family leucine-rich repeat surface protein [Bifidobacterium sp. ESL0732]WEV63920.1 BspA family leucine-rich repeat surface protein [Bifidobacterium sp. ESL0732]